METGKWERWLRDLTGEDSVRGIARKVGKSHTQVQRWIAKGVPPPTVWELTLRFRGDPIAALVVLDRVPPDKVGDINFAAALPHVPEHVLTAELHRRAEERRHMLPRSDAMRHKAFRLTSK